MSDPNYPYSNMGGDSPRMQVKVSFGEAVKRALVEKYCCFTGRASRSEFWWFYVFTIIINIVLNLIVVTAPDAGSIISLVVSFAILLPGLGLAWRRLHDIGKGGGWFFIVLIPIIGWIIYLVFLCKPSEIGPNRFGDMPNLV